MQGEKATLAGSAGLGLLTVRAGQISGYWRAEAGCPRLYTELHSLYQSQESVLYCGCVYDEETRCTSWQRLEVVISSWARHDHPSSLEVCALKPSFN